MTVIKLKDLQDTDVTLILDFNGTVLEVFGPCSRCDDEGPGYRLHIAHIESIELKPGRKGDHHELKIKTEFDQHAFWIDNEIFESANELVSEVQNSKATFHF